MLDNAFTYIADWDAAQRLADECDTRSLREKRLREHGGLRGQYLHDVRGQLQRTVRTLR